MNQVATQPGNDCSLGACGAEDLSEILTTIFRTITNEIEEDEEDGPVNTINIILLVWIAFGVLGIVCKLGSEHMDQMHDVRFSSDLPFWIVAAILVAGMTFWFLTVWMKELLTFIPSVTVQFFSAFALNGLIWSLGFVPLWNWFGRSARTSPQVTTPAHVTSVVAPSPSRKVLPFR